MAIPDGGTEGRQGRWKPRLSNLVQEWERLRRQIRELPEDVMDANGRLVDNPAIKELQDQRRHLVNQIQDIATSRGLEDFAINQGFRADLLPGQGGEDGTPSGVNANEPGRTSKDPKQPSDTGGNGGGGGGAGAGGGGTGGSGSGGGGGGGGQNIDHLPGKLGNDYHFVKGPGGTVKVVYQMDISGPKKGSIAFTIPKEMYDRYNVDPDKVKTLSAQQMKNLKGFGPINEIKLRRGEHPFQGWLRSMKQKFGMAPSMLRDKEVMQTLYAAHLGQWDSTELLGALQQTKWYDTKTKERIDWLFSTGSADKKTKINTATNTLADYTRSVFGSVDWTKHGLGEDRLKKWALNISSGRVGWDLTEAKSRIDEIARGIQGTALWADEERASQGALEEVQEWEDIFEKYRAMNIEHLGPSGRSSKEILTKWAKRRASGEVSDGDYQEFLRKQRADLYPYISGDRTWQQFADPYKASLQRIMGDNASIDWNHELLSDLGGKDNNGKPTGAALSLYDFTKMARDPNKNPDAYQQGTLLFDQGMDKLGNILQRLKGVA